MSHFAVLPFVLCRSQDVIGEEITSTTEMIHGLLRVDGDRLIVQWRVAREISRVGAEIRTDQEFEAVREVTVPLQEVAGAAVRWRGWRWLSAPKIVLTAADLRAFEEIAGAAGLQLDHPATLELQIHRSDHLPAQEFAAELNLARAEYALRRSESEPLTRGGVLQSLPQPFREAGRSQLP